MLTPSSTGQNLYFYLNHPIKWVRLVGVIVTFDIHPTRFIMILDDSSGSTIELTCGRKSPPSKSSEIDARTVDDSWNGWTTAPKKPKEPDNTGVTATGYDIDLQKIDIGSVVKVKGGIGDFRGQRQLLLERISVVQTTTEEAAAWAETTAFKHDILSRHWVVNEEDYKAEKRKAEGLDRELGKKKKRRKRKTIETSTKQGGKVALVSRLQSSKGLRHRVEYEHRWQQNRGTTGSAMKLAEEEVMRQIEREDADRKMREEAAEKLRKEHEKKLQIEEEKQRREREERERLATERRQRNEAKERILREMGAGR